MYRPNLQSVALPVPEMIAIAVLGWGCEPPILSTGGRRGSGIVPFERALVSSYKPSIVTFHLSFRVSDILSLLCSRTPLFPTPPLVCPKLFPHVPLGVGPFFSREMKCMCTRRMDKYIYDGNIPQLSGSRLFTDVITL